MKRDTEKTIENEKILINQSKSKILSQLENKHSSIISLIVYKYITNDKKLILIENKGKTGIYRGTNLINSKTYIGSANDLRTRF